MDRVETSEPQTPPNASSHVLPRTKVGGPLEPVKEEVVQALLGAFEQTVVKQQELTKSHSFQIVGLQNQIQALQNERLLELEDKTIILEELQNCRDEIVYLKGKLAGLTVEFYSSQPPTQKHRSYTPVWAFKWNDKHAYNSSSHRSDTLVPESESRTEQYNFEEGINGHSCTAEAIADQLLLEQRPQLIKGLYDYAQFDQARRNETLDQLRQLDQAPFADALENMTNGDTSMESANADDSFVLEEGLLQPS